MKVLVFVHGAGKQRSDYFKAPLAEITRRLGTQPPFVPVFYADLANIGSSVVIPAAARRSRTGSRTRSRSRSARSQVIPRADSEQMIRFKLAFAMEVRANLNATPPSERAMALFSLPGQDLVELIATELNELTGYLFTMGLFNAIQKRMRDGLAEAAQKGDEIVIASHSLGTVVAFDALFAITPQKPVSKFLTLGSPLARLRALGRRGPDLGLLSTSVREWLNLYDTSDPVASALGPSFPLPGFRLRDVFVDVASAPLPSHDYFRNSETLDEIAAALR